MNLSDTIAAVSTPYGKGGVALIRISGNEALAVADRVFAPASGKRLSECEHARMHYGEIFMPDERSCSIDSGMAVAFFAPYSFTGEDTVEISCHGGVLVTQKVLSAVLCAGARAAEAGEFTRRAYVSGKMKLNEAESLGNLLEAANDSQLALARGGLQGRLTVALEGLYGSLRRVLSGIYACIDFPDEDLSEISREEMEDEVSEVLAEVRRLAATYSTGRAVQEGIPTAICGRTNAGKSSVYNRILGYDAAIVTDVEGTTRDVLRQTASLGRATLLLSDTAGLRETGDKVEKIGIERSWQEIERAELVLMVLDGSRQPEREDEELLQRLCDSEKVTVALINKTDLGECAEAAALATKASRSVRICANSGEGFEELATAIDELFTDGSIDLSVDAVVTGARQYAALNKAEELLRAALNDMREGVSLDACCVGVECAMSALGEIDGREVGQEIVAEIFSKFCVGK